MEKEINMENEKSSPSLNREGRGGSPLISIIMGSTSDLPVMEKAMKFLDEMEVPFEVNALSAHRTPEAVEKFAKGAAARGIKVIIAGAGMAAALPGVMLLRLRFPSLAYLSRAVCSTVWMRFIAFCRCLPAFLWQQWPSTEP